MEFNEEGFPVFRPGVEVQFHGLVEGDTHGASGIVVEGTAPNRTRLYIEFEVTKETGL